MENTYNLLVGTYTKSQHDKGIYIFGFVPATMAVTLKECYKNVASPSYLSIDERKEVLYCVNEDGSNSSVSAFRYWHESGKLQLLNRVATGIDPCYLAHNDRHVLAANYGSGSIAVFERLPDGSLTDAVQVVRHEGGSIKQPRQEGPHVHMVQFSPGQQLVYANNLGNDSVYIYEYDPDGDCSVLALRTKIAVTPGFGPRHLAFHPSGKYFYIVHELAAIVEAYNCVGGEATLQQQVPLYTGNDRRYKSGADIRLTADGRFAYATNRGMANTITAFEISEDGTLSVLQQLASGGDSPRNLIIDPTGSCILVAHENSGNITFFSRNKADGRLSYEDRSISLPSPVFLALTSGNVSGT